jgi:hypothetical protein
MARGEGVECQFADRGSEDYKIVSWRRGGGKHEAEKGRVGQKGVRIERISLRSVTDKRRWFGEWR